MYTIIRIPPVNFGEPGGDIYETIYYLHYANRQPYKLPLKYTSQLEYAARYADIQGYAENDIKAINALYGRPTVGIVQYPFKLPFIEK